MAEENTVTMTVENVDQLFSEIVINGQSHVSDRYVPPQTQEVNTPVEQEETPTEENDTPSAQEEQGEDVYAVELNEVLHNLRDPAIDQALEDEITARREADQALQGDITHINNLIPSEAGVANKLADKEYVQGINTTLQGEIDAVEGDVSDIQDLIPNQASDQNQLADKSFVNSSIATNTANFLGTYTSMADIEAIQNPTNNDYAFLETTDSAGNTYYDRYKYNAEQAQWLFEYELNNSSFTAQQWATINSGLTQQSVDQDIADALSSTKQIVTSSQAFTVTNDIKFLVNTSGVTVTLNYDSEEGAVAKVFAFQACTVTYYTAQGTTASLSMSAGTTAVFIYFNGWKFNGIYGAVWN